LRLSSFGGYGLALAALMLVVFGAYDSYPKYFFALLRPSFTRTDNRKRSKLATAKLGGKDCRSNGYRYFTCPQLKMVEGMLIYVFQADFHRQSEVHQCA